MLNQLKELLQGNQTTNPQGGQAHALTQTLLDIQGLLGMPYHQPSSKSPASTSKGECTQLNTRNAGPSTRSKTKQAYPIGTIISKFFNGTHYEGEIIKYHPKEELYSVRYSDGDQEDFTAAEIKVHKKIKQSHSQQQQLSVDDLRRAMTATLLHKCRYYHKCHQINRLGPFNCHAQAYRLNSRPNKVITAHKALLVRALKAGCIWDDSLKKWLNLEELLKHPDPQVRETWRKSAGKELGSLFQGFRGTKGMDACQFIPKHEVPKGKKVTKPRVVCAHRPEKIDNPFRTRITAGGHLLDFDGETATNSASVETIKILLNSVLSTPGARFATLDIKNMCLESLLKELNA